MLAGCLCMRVLIHTVAGEACRILVPECDGDLEGFDAFLSASGPVAVDTETSGLDVWSGGFRLRLVQFGSRGEAWVLDAARFGEAIRAALLRDRPWVMHNAPFDLLVLDRHAGVPLSVLGPRVVDTRTLAHLVDPRTEAEGGAGLGLKPLSAIYVDPDAPDTQGGLTAVFRSLGLTQATGWAGIPLGDETYLRYAGLDVVFTRRLHDELRPLVSSLGLDHLVRFEHHLQHILTTMQRRGMRLDVAYTERLVGVLTDEQAAFAKVAARYGVANPNSTKQVAEALSAMGEVLRERTASGAPKVDKQVLLPLADLTGDWQRIGAREPNRLADAVLRVKRAGKWRESYAEAFLRMRDDRDRLHPFIGGLQARTARMSISTPPLQQLPSGDATIRRAFVADPGQVLLSCDYSQVEMRVLAALCQDPTLLEAIHSGTDLHDFTAERVFGAGFTDGQRKIAKAIGFGKVYGGGVATISRQTGATPAQVKPALSAYDETFPGIKRYGARLQRQARFGAWEVVTPSGRHLPLDKDRLYAATNYVVQSTARDLLAQALVDLDAAGLGEHLLLPIHDEVLAQAPAECAGEVLAAIADVMDGEFMGVPIVSDPEVYGPAWAKASEQVTNERET